MRPDRSHAPSAVGSAHGRHLAGRPCRRRPRRCCCAAAGPQTLFSPSKVRLQLQLWRHFTDSKLIECSCR